MERLGDLTSAIAADLRAETAWDGGQITMPGVYRGVPLDAYHRDTKLFPGFSISSNGLRKLIRRPSEYWATSPFNPDPDDSESSKALDFGKAAHAILLGDEDFAAHYVIRPDTINGSAWQSNRTVCKDWLAEHADRTVVTTKDLAAIERIAKAMRLNPVVASGLLSGRAERTMVARDGDIWLKARPDVIPNADGMFVDLKTAADVSDDGINRAIGSAGYHVQAGLQRMIVRALGGAFDAFAFVFVEKAPPFDVRVKQLDPESLDLGERQAMAGIRLLKRCLDENRWPGFDGFGDAEGYAGVAPWLASRITIDLDIAERTAA